MKNCPYCAEEIQEEARKCRYCGEWLDNDKKGSEPLTTKKPEVRKETVSRIKKRDSTFWFILIFIIVLLIAFWIEGRRKESVRSVRTSKEQKTSEYTYDQKEAESNLESDSSAEKETETFRDEKTDLLNSSYYGDFRKAKKIKKTGKAALEIWSDRAEYIQKGLGYSPDINKLTVEYDEIWERRVDDFLSKEEKGKSWNDLDISKIYWKGNKVQASTLEKKFIGNPQTGEKFSAPIYKITELDDRNHVLKNLSE